MHKQYTNISTILEKSTEPFSATIFDEDVFIMHFFTMLRHRHSYEDCNILAKIILSVKYSLFKDDFMKAAFWENFPEFVDIAVQMGADISVPAFPNSDLTLLDIIASDTQHFSNQGAMLTMMDILIKHGGDKESALAHAFQKADRAIVVNNLVQRGANISKICGTHVKNVLEILVSKGKKIVQTMHSSPMQHSYQYVFLIMCLKKVGLQLKTILDTQLININDVCSISNDLAAVWFNMELLCV